MSRYRYSNRQGQTSLEFMAMLIFAMFVFTAFYSSLASNQTDVQNQQETLMAENIANDAVFELQMALTQGDGYSRNFTLPHALLGNTYTVNLTSGTLIVQWDDRNLYKDAPITTINGNITPAENQIRNDDGELYVD